MAAGSSARQSHGARTRAPEAAILAPAILAIAAAIAVSLLSSRPATQRLFDNLHWTVAYSAAALLAWLGVRRAGVEERRTRLWFALALSAYALGQLLWDVQVAVGWNPFPGPSDIFFVCLGPFCGIGLLELLWRRTSPWQRRTAMLDIAGLTAAVLALTLALYLPRRGQTTMLPLAVLVAYPVVLSWAASVGVIVGLTLRLSPRPGWLLFLGSLFANGALWLQWNSLTLDNALQDGTPFNALFSIVALGQGLGALYFRAETTPSLRLERVCEGVLRMLPLMIVMVSALAVVLVYTLPDAPLAMRRSILFGAFVVVLLASVRQVVLIGERDRLIEAERTLRLQQEAYGVLVEQAADGIFIADQNGSYVDVNRSGCEMLQMTREEIIGRPIGDIVAPEQGGRVADEIADLRDGKTVSRAWLLKRKDGTIFPAEVSAKMLPDGRLQGMVRDVSQRQALEEQLRRGQKLEAIGTLAAGIAHDFNNLLAAIRGHTDLLAREVADRPAALERLSEIRHAGTRATELVQQILTFSRPSKPATAEVRPPELVAEVVRLLRSTLPAGVELRAECADDTPAISGDASQLHQVLVNLCTNAWQAFDGRPGKITLRTARATRGEHDSLQLTPGEYARISVADDGKGIDPALRERIFEPFFTTKQVGEGTGLGLSVVHSIVRNHGGAITFESTPGRGTTFVIDLPAGAATASEAMPAAVFEPALASIAEAPARVLYVDDEQSIVSLMKSLLAIHGHQVTGFAKVHDALAHIEADPQAFDVLVSDYNMPAMSGLELVERVRPLRPDTPFILTSGYIDENLQRAADAAGVRYLAQKPVATEELLRAIANVRAHHT